MPTFNEAGNIVPLVERLAAALRGVPHELLVMDDRSPDGTAALAREQVGRFPQLRVIERDPPAGLTRSIREGVERARGVHVVWLDCDLSHPPELAAPMWEAIASGGAEMIVASRYADGGRDARDSAFTRLYSRVINRLCQLAIHGGVRDYTSGYVMGERDTSLAIGLNGDYGEYCIELLGRAALGGVRVREVGYAMTDRIEGESKTLPSLPKFVARGVRYLGAVARMTAERFRGRRPGQGSGR